MLVTPAAEQPSRRAQVWLTCDVGKNYMTQVYLSGEEVQLGDRVRCKDDDGKIVALENGLSEWGLSPEEAKGKVMIEYKKMKFVCEYTDSNEDLDFIGRAGS